MVTIENIRARLAEAIAQSGYTQSELAKRVGIKQPQISCYISGKKMPALDTLAKLCNVIDVDTNYILCQDLFE